MIKAIVIVIVLTIVIGTAFFIDSTTVREVAEIAEHMSSVKRSIQTLLMKLLSN